MAKDVQSKFKKTGHKTELLGNFSLKVLAILQKLGEGHTQAEIAEMSSFSKSGVNYWVKKFLKRGLVCDTGYKYPKYYKLTPQGSAILTRSEVPSIPCRMEDYPMKFRLVSDMSGLDWEKLGEPNNWVKMGIQVGQVRVEKNLGKVPTIVVHTGQIIAPHPDYCLLMAGSIIADVKAILRGHGVLVDDVGLPLRKAIFQFFTKEAQELHNKLGNVKTDNGTLDASYPRIPHAEYTRETAVNYLEAPDRIARIEQRQIENMKILGQLKENETRLIEVVGKLQEDFSFILCGSSEKKVGPQKQLGGNPFSA